MADDGEVEEEGVLAGEEEELPPKKDIVGEEVGGVVL